jgi:hypothetical protein
MYNDYASAGFGYANFLGQTLDTGSIAPVGAVTPSTSPFAVEGPPKPTGNSFGDMVKSFLEGVTNPQILLPGHSASEASGGIVDTVASTASLLTDLPRLATIFLGGVLIVVGLIGLTKGIGE